MQNEAKKQRRTTPADREEMVRMYASGASTTVISRTLGFSEPSINYQLRKAGVTLRSPREQSSQTPQHVEDQIIDMYMAGVLWPDIVAETGGPTSEKTLYNILKRRGLPPQRYQSLTPDDREELVSLFTQGDSYEAISKTMELPERYVRHFFREDEPSVFRDIDTPEKAYWLGFITADGTIVGIRPGNLRVEVTLKGSDSEHLENLNRFTSNTRDLKHYEAETISEGVRPYARFVVSNRAVVADLLRGGVHPNKTGREKPWDGPEHLMRHYWRGVIDGDGSIYDSHRSPTPSVVLVGSEDLCSAFLLWANKVCGTKTRVQTDLRSPNHYRASVGGNRQVQELVHELYRDCDTFLRRKMGRAQRICKF
jgi:transposase-like protein